MPRKKTETVTPATYEAEDAAAAANTGTAVLDGNYGDAAQAAIGAVEADKKMWRALAHECAGGKDTPPAFLLKRLAPAVGISDLLAVQKFEEDVLALKNLKQAEASKERYELKQAEFIAEHATEKELQEQLQTLVDEQKKVRQLIKEIQHIEFVLGTKKAITRRIGSAFTRLF